MPQDIFAPYFLEREIKDNLVNEQEDLFAEYLGLIGGTSAKTGTKNASEPKLARRDEQSKNGQEYTGELYDLAVTGGSVVLPEFGVLACDIYARDGRVALLSQGAVLPSRQVISAKGQTVLPGIIDPHVHMGFADSLSNELQSETFSALHGGVTTAGLFINADKAYMANYASIVEQVNSFSHINIFMHFIVANNEQIAAIPQVVKAGVRSFKVFLHGVDGLIESKDDAFIVDTMAALKATGERCVLLVHTENHSLIKRATEQVRKRVGDSATLLDWAETHPEISEEEAVIRIAYFAEKLQQLTYIVHISSAGAINKLREIRKTNPYVFCETVSPYLMLEPDKLQGFAAKMEPPIRGGQHIETLWQSLKDGVIDTIGTDNVSWDLSQKNLGKTVWDALPGYPALATHMPSVLTGGYINRGFDLTLLVSKMTSMPAKVFDIYPKKGTLLPGSDADMVLVDLQNMRKVDPKDLHSRSDFSIYENQFLAGWPSTTIVGGQIVMLDGQVLGAPKGRLLR